MLTSNGDLAFLDAQASYLATCYWGLYTDDVAGLETDTLATHTEAAWSGYARQLVGPLTAAALVAGIATVNVTAFPVFTNSSASQVGFYGYLLIDPTQTLLLAADYVNALGIEVLIPAGLQATLVPTMTCRDISFG